MNQQKPIRSSPGIQATLGPAPILLGTSFLMRVNEQTALFRGEAKQRIAWIHWRCRRGRCYGDKYVIVLSERCYGMNAGPGRQVAKECTGAGINNTKRLSSTARSIEAIIA